MPTTTTATGTIQEFAPEFKPLASLVGGAAEAQLGRAYTPYGGDRTAGFTPAQQAVQTGIMGLAPPPQFASAQQAYTGAQGSITAPGALTGYTTPFNANVTDIARQQMMRDYAIQEAQRGAQFARSGAFGGSRQAVTEAEAQRNLNQQLQDLQFKGNAAAYQQAVEQFNKERTQQMTAGQNLTSLGQTQQQAQLTQLQAQSGVGQQQQGLNQQQLDQAYQNFLNQRDWAKEQTGWASGVLQGIPGGVGTTAKTEAVTTPSGNPWIQAAGALGTVSQLGKTFKWWE